MIKKVFIFLLPFIIVNILLLITPFKSFILSLNSSSYFYINHDWQLKFDHVLVESLKGKAAFVGTSRTLYGIDLSQLKGSGVNLGLMAASQAQINKMLQHLAKKEEKLEVLFLEVNPMSLSSNHIDSMSRQEMEGFINYRPWEYKTPVMSYIRTYLPVMRYANIIKKSLSSFFAAHQAKGDRGYIRWRKKIHMNEFNVLDNKTFHGGILVEMNDFKRKRFRERLHGECLAMLKQSFRDSELKLDLLEEGIRYALSAAKKVVLWSPPYSNESFAVVPQGYLIEINNLIENKGLPVLRPDELIWGESYFFDCIHLNRIGADELMKIFKIDNK